MVIDLDTLKKQTISELLKSFQKPTKIGQEQVLKAGLNRYFPKK